MQSPVVLAPGVRSAYGNGWRQMWRCFLELFLILILGIVISIPTGMGRWATGGAGSFLGFLAFVYSVLVAGPVDYGIAFAYLKTARGDRVEVRDMFQAFQNYWNAVLASVLVGVIVVIGFILLIIPGIIFACKLAFTPYLIVDRKMEAVEAVKESWRMTGGYSWKVFFIGLLGIPICIIGLVCFVVGIVVAIMWIQAALASLYHAVSTLDKASEEQGLSPQY